MDAFGSDYRTVKESFVQNLSGTTKGELLLMAASLSAGIFFLLEIRHHYKHFFPEKNTFLTFFEFAYLLFLALMTLLKPDWISVFMICGLSTVAALRISSRKHLVYEENKKSTISYAHTAFRGTLLASTIISILAVDFHIFPRRLAKTETYGFGFMDIGSAAFIFSSGLQPFKSSRLLTKKTFYLAMLTFSRFASVKLLGYPEHVTEYGVHWNFFATVLCVRFVVALWHRLGLNLGPCLTAFGACSVHMFITSVIGSEYVLNSPRNLGFFSANREGIIGISGYSAIYFISQCIRGSVLVHTQNETDQSNCSVQIHQKIHTLNKRDISALKRGFLCCGALLSSSYFFEVIFDGQHSRRLMNMSFLLFTCGNLTLYLMLLMMAYSFSSTKHNFLAFDLLSGNMLGTFLLANVLTGIINLSTNTLMTSDFTALMILVSYAIVVVAGAYMCNKKNICI